ncbi:hypothetical protein JCM3774_004234 [Rhodotorula dairenensis]
MLTNQAPLELVPGTALGPFHLGSLLFNVLNHVREYRGQYPHARLAWDQEHPLSEPVHLSLTTPPLHLTFSPPAQRLSRIQVTGPRPGAHVTYRSQRLQDVTRHVENGQEDGEPGNEGEEEEDEEGEDVVKRIRRILGPTFGSSKAPTGTHEDILSYPGVAFGVTSTRSGSKRLRRVVVTPLPTSNGVPVDQAWLHPRVDDGAQNFGVVMYGDLQRAVVELDPDGVHKPLITLHFHSDHPAAAAAAAAAASSSSSSSSSSPSSSSPESKHFEPVVLEIGVTTSEDILCELGSAIRIFWKEDDRLMIHTAAVGTSSRAALEPNPYFLSYPHLGLTVLVTVPSSSGQPHVLEKVILHSNTPGQVQFGRTARALWTLKTRRPTRPNGPGAAAADGGGTDLDRERGLDQAHVEVERGFAAVREFLCGGGIPGGTADERPMELDRTAYHSASGGVGSTTGQRQQGSAGGQQDSGIRGLTTEIHGFSSGVACEVTQSGDVETLWLF